VVGKALPMGERIGSPMYWRRCRPNPSTQMKPISRGSAGCEISKTPNRAANAFSRLMKVSGHRSAAVEVYCHGCKNR
jgi:hypothetical protein